MIARTTSSWCAYWRVVVVKNRLSGAPSKWPRTGTRKKPDRFAQYTIRSNTFQNTVAFAFHARYVPSETQESSAIQTRRTFAFGFVGEPATALYCRKYRK